MGNALKQIHDQLVQVFGGSNPNQFFCLQMPATALNQQTYAYDTNDVKPALVAEAESQLVDQMFDLSPITGSSNGQRLSSQFLQALSVLVPNYDPMMPVVKNALRQFINQRMPSDTLLDGKPFVGTLQEYYFALYEQWVQKKLAWDTEQQAVKDRLAADPSTENEKFLEWYEGAAEARLAEIDAAMGKVLAIFAPSDMDAIMGALAAGPGGAIDEAIDIVKDIRLMSPSGGWIYPVELTPSDWFLDLASDINPTDLLQDPQFIAAGISARREALMASISQVQALLNTVPTPAAMQGAVQALSSAQTAYTAAQSNLLNTYADNTATAVEIYLSTYSGGLAQPGDDQALAELNADAVAASKAKNEQPPATGALTKDGLPITAADVQKLVAGQKTLIAAQSSLLSSSQALADAGLNLASAQSRQFGDLPVLLARLQSQLGDLTTQQQQLVQSIGASANAAPTSPPPKALSQAASDALSKISAAASAAAGAANATADSVATAVAQAIPATDPAKTELASISAAAAAAKALKPTATQVAMAVRSAANDVAASATDPAVAAAAKSVADAADTAVGVANATADSVKTAVQAAITASGHATDLTSVGTAATTAAAKTPSAGDVAAAVAAAVNALSLTPRAYQSAASPRYMNMQLSFTSDSMTSSSSATDKFSQTSWGVDLFFGSASGSSSSSSAVTAQSAFDSSTAIQIGLKATKVNVTREWFDPGLFKLTGDMSRIAHSVVSAGPLPTLANSPTEIDWNSPRIAAMNDAMVPCFPVAFVVAKDVTIKFKATESSLDAVHSVLDSRSAAGGGFLCFSVSSSSASHSDTQALTTKSEGTVITLTIPGPQIMGWFLEVTPQDQSTLLSANSQPGDDINIMKFVSLLQAISPAPANAAPAVPLAELRPALRTA